MYTSFWSCFLVRPWQWQFLTATILAVIFVLYLVLYLADIWVNVLRYHIWEKKICSTAEHSVIDALRGYIQWKSWGLWPPEEVYWHSNSIWERNYGHSKRVKQCVGQSLLHQLFTAHRPHASITQATISFLLLRPWTLLSLKRHGQCSDLQL